MALAKDAIGVAMMPRTICLALLSFFFALRALDSASCSALSPQRAGIYPSVEMNL